MEGSLLPMKSPTTSLLFAVFCLLHAEVIIARSVSPSATDVDQPSSAECVEQVVEKLRAASTTAADKPRSSSDNPVTSIVQEYVDCVAVAERRRSGRVVNNKLGNEGPGVDGTDVEDQQKRLELVKLINETVTIFGAASTTPNDGFLSLAVRKQQPLTVKEYGDPRWDNEDTNVERGRMGSVGNADLPPTCLTVECLTRLGSTALELCMKVADKQCSALLELCVKVATKQCSALITLLTRLGSTALELCMEVADKQCSALLTLLTRLGSTALELCMKVADKQCSALLTLLAGVLQSRRPFFDDESKIQIDERPLIAPTTPVEEDMWQEEGKKVDTEEERKKEQQINILRHAIFAVLRDLIIEYETRRLDPELVIDRSKRSVDNRILLGEDGMRKTKDDRMELDFRTHLDWFNNDRRPLSTNVAMLRSRRAVNVANVPFKIPEKITPETQALLEAYLAWREKNGYGKISGRWG